MNYLLIVNATTSIYRYMTDFGPSTQPVVDVEFGIGEGTNGPSQIGTGWDFNCCECDGIGGNQSTCAGNCANYDCNCPKAIIPSPGFTMDTNKILTMFNELIGLKWNGKTLVPTDANVTKAPFPIVRVNFSPSLENIATVIYQIMAPQIAKCLGVKLLYVCVYRSDGSRVKYYPNGIAL